MREGLFATLTPTTTVLTATRPLAERFLFEYNAHQQQLGYSVWTTPNILSLANWLYHAWQMAMESGTCPPLRLLNAEQELNVWLEVIKASKQAELLRLHETAQAVQQAWQLLKHWQLSIEHPSFTFSADATAFQQWARAFVKRCHKNNWIDNASLPEKIIAAIKKQGITLPEHIVLLGFDEISPLTQALLAAMQVHGCQTEIMTSKQLAEQIQRVECSDQAHEIASMANWTKQVLTNHPHANIGCIVPELDTIAPNLERAFMQTFSQTESQEQPFYVAQTKVLSDYPLIQSALDILALAEDKVDFNLLSTVLRSAFIAGAETEMCSRALLDATLRRQGQSIIFPKTALHNQSNGMPMCPIWQQHFKAYLRLKPKVKKQSASVWAKFFILQLQAIGWSGERALNHLEQQLIACWNDVLQIFASLDQIANNYTWQQALSHLQKLVRSTRFLDPSKHKPIQVLTPQEAAGMQFTHLWVMGLTQEAWPSPAHPSPFIPLALQREQHMPHSSPERELHFCRLITERLLHSSEQVVLSYPAHEEARHLQPSRLISEFPAVSYAALNLDISHDPIQTLYASRLLEEIVDEQAPPVKPEESLKGGSDIFKLQAACPMRAFLHIRLGAKPLEQLQTSLTAADKGSIIHRALELIWQSLGTHTQLCGYSQEQLHELITQSVEQALEQVFGNKSSKALNSRYYQLERQRVINLLNQWLVLEKQRPSFTVVATEQKHTVELGGIPLTLRIDRIDALADGSHMIIDYKTGKTNIDSWFGERPDEPQLPLYAVVAAENVSGLAFASLHQKELGFKGHTAVREYAPELKNKRKQYASAEEWAMQVQNWRNALERLALQFQAGDARVAPKKFPQTCKHCALLTFCRYHEQQTYSLEINADDT